MPGRQTQVVYTLPIDFARDGSVDPDAQESVHTARVRSLLPASLRVDARTINIGRGGDGLGLILSIAGLAVSLFYGAPHTAAALKWWRRLLRTERSEDALVAVVERDPDNRPFAMSPDLAMLLALRHVEGDDRGAAQPVRWDEIVFDRFDVFEGDGLEQSPERMYFFVLDHRGQRSFVAMRADGLIVQESAVELPGGWMEYQAAGNPDLTELAETLRSHRRMEMETSGAPKAREA